MCEQKHNVNNGTETMTTIRHILIINILLLNTFPCYGSSILLAGYSQFGGTQLFTPDKAPFVANVSFTGLPHLVGCATVSTPQGIFIIGGSKGDVDTYGNIADVTVVVPETRYIQSVYSDENYNILVCGGYSGYDIVASCEYYLMQHNRWTEVAHSLPQSSYGLAFGIINNIVYSFGGTNGADTEDDVIEYNNNTGWAHVAIVMPLQLAFHSLIPIRNGTQALICGGRLNEYSGATSNSCFVFYPTTMYEMYEFINVSHILSPRMSHTMIEYNDTFYIIGGLDEHRNPVLTIEQYDITDGATLYPHALKYGYIDKFAAAVIPDKLQTTTAFIIDGLLGTEFYLPGFAKITDVPFALPNLIHAAAVVLHGNAYFIGGHGSDSYNQSNDTVIVFDPKTNQSAPAPSMIQARAAHSATVANDRIIVCGGTDSVEIFASCEQFTTSTQKWNMITPLPHAISLFTMSTLHNNAYAFGGASRTPGYPPQLSTVVQLNGSVWISKSSMPVHVMQHASVSLDDDRALICGGCVTHDNDTCVTSANCYIYTASTDEWTTAASMAIARQEHEMGLYNDMVYIFGSQCTGEGFRTIEVYSPETGGHILGIKLNTDYSRVVAAIEIPSQNSKPSAQTADVLSRVELIALICSAVIIILIICVIAVVCIKLRIEKQKVSYLNAMQSLRKNQSIDNNTAPHSVYEISPDRLDTLEKLGSGAFSVVYKGYLRPKSYHYYNDTTPTDQYGADVAVKVPHGYPDINIKQDFVNEIEFMMELGHHQHLVNLVACITKSDPICIITELCAHGDLLQYVRKYKEEVSVEFSRFAYQISDGMTYLSSKGFIHRDLAARNILIDSRKTAKIGDFGLCRLPEIDSYTSLSRRLPFRWMAIESLVQSKYTTKTDVWSYGVLLWEMYSYGSIPYQGIQPNEMFDYLKKGNRLCKPPAMDDAIYEPMLSCWHSDDNQRPTFSQLRDAFRQMIEGDEYLQIRNSFYITQQ